MSRPSVNRYNESYPAHRAPQRDPMKHCLLHRVALMHPMRRGWVNGVSMGWAYGHKLFNEIRLGGCMEYRVIAGDKIAHLEKKVNEAMKEGWKPHGSLATKETPQKLLQRELPDYEPSGPEEGDTIVEYLRYFQPMIRD